MYEHSRNSTEIQFLFITKKFIITTSYLIINLLQDYSRYQFIRDIHPDQKSGKHVNHCFAVTNKTNMHESISLGKYFKELMQSKKQTVQSIRTS